MSWHEGKVNSGTCDATKCQYFTSKDGVVSALTGNLKKQENDPKRKEVEDEKRPETEITFTNKVRLESSNAACCISKSVPRTTISNSSLQPISTQKSRVVYFPKDDVLAIPSTSEKMPRGSVSVSDNTANESSASVSDESNSSSEDSATENTESQTTEKSSESSSSLTLAKGPKSADEDRPSLFPVQNLVQAQIVLKKGITDVAQNYIYSAPVHSLCSDISAESAAKALTTTAKALTKTANMLSGTSGTAEPLSPYTAATDLAFVTTALSDVTWTLSSLLTTNAIEYDQNKMTMLVNAAAIAEARALSLVQSATKLVTFSNESSASLVTKEFSNQGKSTTISLDQNSMSNPGDLSAYNRENTSTSRFEYSNRAVRNIKDSLDSFSDSTKTHSNLSFKTENNKEPITADSKQKLINAEGTNRYVNADHVSLDSKTVEQCEDVLKTENYPESFNADKTEKNNDTVNDKKETNYGDVKSETDQRKEAANVFKVPDVQGSNYSILVDNGYTIQYTLGTGSFSSVKVAMSQKHKCKVAVRIMTKSKVPQIYLDKFLPRVLKVVRILRHPNIVQFMQVIETTHRVYFVMEYAEHGSLLDRIRRDTYILESLARKWFRQIAEAINYLHEQGIVHRDIKCDNMLLDCYDDIKVSKFIFSRPNMLPTNGNDVLSETYCGTPAYAAPEILRGIPYKPHLSDVWSIGVVLFAMVYGRLPYTDDNIRILAKKMEGKLTFPSKPKVSAQCRSLLSRMLTQARRRINISTVLCDRWCIDGKRPSTAPLRSTVQENVKNPPDSQKFAKILSPLKRFLRMKTNSIREEHLDECGQYSSGSEDHSRTKRNITIPLIESSNVPFGHQLCLPATRTWNSLSASDK